MRSRPDEIRFLGLQPAAASSDPIEAARALRHDALMAKLADAQGNNRALGGERFAEQNSADALDSCT
jgi:hypothetical protein